MIKLHLNEEQTFVEGRSQETAADLLSRAAKHGLEAEVYTTTNGYIVPKVIMEGEDEEVATVATSEADANTGDATVQADSADADKTDGSAEAEAFDPSAHTVSEVQEYLEGADEDERQRVLQAEADGKARKTIVQTEEG